MIEKEGKEMTERGLDLAGKLSSILCSQVDTVGYMYRRDNETVINFKPSESITCGSRSEHLKNVEVVVLDSNEKGELTSHWDKIFTKLQK